MTITNFGFSNASNCQASSKILTQFLNLTDHTVHDDVFCGKLIWYIQYIKNLLYMAEACFLYICAIPRPCQKLTL